MKDFNIIIPVKSFSCDELDEQRRHLVDLACEATSRSYSPYSHFRVGAAIELDNGEIVTGANQENVAYHAPNARLASMPEHTTLTRILSALP